MNRNIKITEFSMLDNYEAQGIWWLPETDDELSGSLYRENGWIYLDVLGNFSEMFDDISEPDYIHGFTAKGEEVITL